MSASIIIAIVSAIFIVSVKLKVPLGAAFLGCAIVLAILSGMAFGDIAITVLNCFVKAETLRLVGIVYLISLLGVLLADLGALSKMVETLQTLVADRRVCMVVPAGLIGLLPMPGGAMLSAPMVEEGAKPFDISKEKLTFLNFWFRHIWEYVWPLYPAIILSTGLLEISAGRLIGAMWPMTIAMVIYGFLISFRNMKVKDCARIESTMSRPKALWEFLKITWYIWAVVIFVLGFGLDILPVVAICALLMLLFSKRKCREKLRFLKDGLSWRVLTMVASVMVFKGIIQGGDILQRLTAELSGVPPTLLLFIIPFSIGLITGVNSAYAGLGFPLLIPFLLPDGFDAGNYAFAYAAGYSGVLLSPVHLCLLLTKEYFNARWLGIYRYLVPAVFSVLVLAVVILIIR